MQYITVGHFFLRIQNISNVLLIIPLLVFLSYYVLVSAGYIGLTIGVETGSDNFIWLYLLLIAVVLGITFGVTGKQLRNISNITGLGEKLSRAGDQYLVRIVVTTILSVGAGVATYINNDSSIGILFAVILVIHFITRPTPARVSRHLNLKGDEKKMVETRGEAFK